MRTSSILRKEQPELSEQRQLVEAEGYCKIKSDFSLLAKERSLY
jgi:hypothetical protein